MILIDTNLLLYASYSSFPQHGKARSWMPWASLMAFLRIATNARIFEKPARMDAAFAQIESWLNCPVVWIPQPADQHAAILKRLLLGFGASSQLVPDAHLAALAIEYGLTLCSADGDFARFHGLKWLNPIAPPKR